MRKTWPRNTFLIKGDENMDNRTLSSLGMTKIWPIDIILM